MHPLRSRSNLASILVLLSACSGGDDRAVAAFDPMDGARPADCRPLVADFQTPGTLESLTAADDTMAVLHFADARTVVVARPDAPAGALRELRRYTYPNEGPGAVRSPRGAVAIGESVVVADATGRLVTLHPDGSHETRPVTVAVDRLLRAGDAFVLTRFPGPGPRGLAFHLADDNADGDPVPVEIPPVKLEDPQMTALANLMVPAVSPDGRRAAFFHQFIAPVAHSATLVPRPEITSTHAVPLPEALADQAWWSPPPPYAQEEMERVVLPVLGATFDAGGDRLLALVRTGRSRGDLLEKAILVLDQELGPRQTLLLDFNATHLVRHGGQGRLLLLDDLGGARSCAAS